VQGLPFCPSADHPRARVDLFVPGAWDAPGNGGRDAAAPRRLLARAMSPPHFPIGPEGLLGAWRFLPARPGVLSREGPVVSVARVPHKGGVTLGIRVELGGAGAVYLPDHLPGGPLPGDARAGRAVDALVEGADVLLHDGQFLDRERERARGYGHATIGDALRLADRCGVGRLVLTHHAPGRTDDELDALAAAVTRTPAGRPVSFARQGDVIDVTGRNRAARVDRLIPRGFSS
jgi:phosphoribosyl 1,2-cyclic phosphodiesterase